MRLRRIAVVLGTMLVLLVPGPAFADPAGPTDFESRIESVTPSIEGVQVEMIGGDSFVLMEVASQVTVEVVGYRGEPYLRFLPDGTVEQNDRSPTAYLNEDRYAVVEIPPEASADADPVWRIVATDGSYAWHDHRAHWMNDAPPPGRQPGDRILEGVVPIVLDDTEVDIAITSVWVPSPAPWPVLAGGILGLLAAVGAAATKRMRTVATSASWLNVAAFAVGTIAYRSVPPETGPALTLWALPLLGLTVSMLARFPRIAGPGRALLTNREGILVVASTGALLAWAVLRWDWLWRAILPTDAPFWVDRLVTAVGLTGGAGLAAIALWLIADGAAAGEVSAAS